ncbi:recombinase family protein [Salipaludibacillus agaradhaerens]|jgi:site-specific DNA recombinase|uniref:Recombinase family protein n=1 Tax=Salipaludibacillus agaradhaerens TaxID=76935 RepID=A0A9Q4B1Z6_SALAG|nr:recombinase family protein [Salipaludibacillus agaradhaerens]MCR6096839.1 recombinase family protein [Salipaludibacillus agaradhaerens]MCR6116683.1 recombinase family protein [Salipaludibacillus agaradhaerens]
MKAAYVRVSSEESKKKGYSIKNQVDDCKRKAETNEIIIYKDEGVSGEFLERPGLEKLRKDVREGIITKLYIYDPDRLSRKLMNQLILDDEFRKSGVEVIYVNGDYAQTPEGQLFYSIRGAVSEFEKAKITQRTKSGRKRKAMEGKAIKYVPVYGYDKDKEKESFKINEREAKVVKLIFDLFTYPNNKVQGINSIAKYLTDQKIPTKKGKSVWHRQVVRQILSNTIYKGVFYQNKMDSTGYLEAKLKNIPFTHKIKEQSEWIALKVPSIISEEQWQHAQDILKESRRRWAKKGQQEYLLSGLMRCTKCGNTITGAMRNNWGTKVRHYTCSKNYAGAKNTGCPRFWRADDIEKEIWSTILNLLHDPDKMAEYREEVNQDFEKSEIERLGEEIAKRKNGRKRLMKLFAMEEANEEEILNEIQELKKEEDELLKQKEKYENNLINEKPNNHQEAINKINDYLSNDELSTSDKQEIIRTLVQEIRIDANERVDIVLF